jgi:molybdenum cofactor biosynthesis protein B
MNTHTSSEQHRKAAESRGPVQVALVTVSDTRTGETDFNGKFLKEKIEDAGHSVAFYRIIKDEPDQVLSALEEAVSEKANIALFNGGTGVSSRDTTIDVISGKLEKELPGFGELFRMFSYDQVGAAAMFSRATAGVYRGTAVISIPGSPKAVQLAWEKLIGPELAHLAWEVTR